MEWITSKRSHERVFNKLPERFQYCWVDTNHGIFKAKYDSWYPDGILHFDVKAPPVNGGYTVYAWMPLTDNQPERSKREDL
jgi:hypothetical protein